MISCTRKTVYNNQIMRQDFKVRIGIIGTGFIVDRILEAAKENADIKINAIYSRTYEKAADFSKKYDIPYIFTSLEEMASSSIIDAIYIASPNALHAPQSILFMKHGKHVLCEKPLASNALEVKQMIEASNIYNVTFMEAMKSTLTPNFAQVIRHLKDIGKIRHYFACYCQYSSRYDKLKEGVVLNAFKPELSNGAVMDIGIYTIYPMVVLFGKPLKINASGVKLFTGVDGQGSVIFEYEDMTATVMYSKITDSSLPSEIQGEDGTIILDRINCINQVELVSRKISKDIISQPTAKNEYYYELKEFIELIKTGKRESLINSHLNSFITIEIIDEIRRQVDISYPSDTM